jgi:FkbM family methyltransferase
MIAKIVKTLLGLKGLTLTSQLNSQRYQRRRLFERRKIDLVLDVGANEGQYGMQLRNDGYRGEIISFEPLPGAYQKLYSKTELDAKWTARNLALGANDAKHTMQITQNGVSSSLLKVARPVIEYLPECEVIANHIVVVNRLDSELDPQKLKHRSIHLKIDVQGFELAVLDGAAELVPLCGSFEIEASLSEMYEDQSLLPEMLMRLQQLGATIIGVFPQLHHPANGNLLQVDLLAERNNTDSETVARA